MSNNWVSNWRYAGTVTLVKIAAKKICKGAGCPFEKESVKSCG